MPNYRSNENPYHSNNTKRQLVISTEKTDSTNSYQEFCTVTKSISKDKKLEISKGETGAFSDLKLFDQENNLYTFPVSSNRNKSFFISLVNNIAKKFDVCEPEPQPKTFDNHWENKIENPIDAKAAYLGNQDPIWRKYNSPPPQPTVSE